MLQKEGIESRSAHSTEPGDHKLNYERIFSDHTQKFAKNCSNPQPSMIVKLMSLKTIHEITDESEKYKHDSHLITS